jgi:hypothetical protein
MLKAASRKCGRMASPLNKYLVSVRWMGTKVAVYDLSVQVKPTVGGETSRAQRGTKRRGSRGVRKTGRKCRRLATADPGSSSYRYPQKSVWPRRDYLESRFNRWVERRLRELVKLKAKVKRINPGRVPAHRFEETCRFKGVLRRAHTAGFRRVVEASARKRGDSIQFSEMRLRVAMQILRDGYTNINIHDGSESETEMMLGYSVESPLAQCDNELRFVEFRKRTVVTMQHRSGSARIVEQPRSWIDVGKTRALVAKAPLCTICGMKHLEFLPERKQKVQPGRNRGSRARGGWFTGSRPGSGGAPGYTRAGPA